MVAAVVFSVIQLNTTAVRASGPDSCPPGYSVFCGNCYLSYALVWNEGQTVFTECHYDCYCSGGGGGDPMYIEQTVTVHD